VAVAHRSLPLWAAEADAAGAIVIAAMVRGASAAVAATFVSFIVRAWFLFALFRLVLWNLTPRIITAGTKG
jgi:hypothetical protein